MIRDKLPQDLNFVSPTDIIIDSIEELERQMSVANKMLAETLKKLASYRAKVDKLQEDINLVTKYVE